MRNQTLREVGRTDCRGVSRRHSAIQRHVSVGVRHLGKNMGRICRWARIFSTCGTLLAAAQQEYVVVFPRTTSGRFLKPSTNPERRLQHGIQLKLLQETTSEMARNAARKSSSSTATAETNICFLFRQAQTRSPARLFVYSLTAKGAAPVGRPKINRHRYTRGERNSNTMVSRPDLVHLDRAASESGSDQKRVNLPDNVYTGIWWYGRFRTILR